MENSGGSSNNGSELANSSTISVDEEEVVWIEEEVTDEEAEEEGIPTKKAGKREEQEHKAGRLMEENDIGTKIESDGEKKERINENAEQRTTIPVAMFPFETEAREEQKKGNGDGEKKNEGRTEEQMKGEQEDKEQQQNSNPKDHAAEDVNEDGLNGGVKRNNEKGEGIMPEEKEVKEQHAEYGAETSLGGQSVSKKNDVEGEQQQEQEEAREGELINEGTGEETNGGPATTKTANGLTTRAEMQQPAKGVRFVEGGEEEMAPQLEKLRRNTKEALELLDKISELQQVEGTITGREHHQQPKAPILRQQMTAKNDGSDIEQKQSFSNRSGEDELGKALAEGVRKLAGQEGEDNGGSPSERAQIDEGAALEMECVSVSAALLDSPSDCLMLPGRLLLIVDSEVGLSLLSLDSKQVVKRLAPQPDLWRNAECACLGGGKEDGGGQQHVYVLLEYNLNARNKAGDKDNEETNIAGSSTMDANVGEAKEGQQEEKGGQSRSAEGEGEAVLQNGEGTSSKVVMEAGDQKQSGGEGGQQVCSRDREEGQTMKANGAGRRQQQQQQQKEEGQKRGGPRWERCVCRFSLPDFSLVDSIEGPKWLRERVVVQCRLCFVDQTQCLYLAANSPNRGFLFELHTPRGRWTECKGTRLHSQFADLHAFSVVEPVTELLLVETSRAYVQLISVYGSNVVSARLLGLCERPGSLCVDERGNVLVHDRATSTVGLYSRAFLEKLGDLALVDRAHCQLSAHGGLLAVLCPVTRELKLHRYGDRQRAIQRQLEQPPASAAMFSPFPY